MPETKRNFKIEQERSDYLIECSRAAREEILFRIKHRDSWLKLELYIQAILWALANGIKLGAESASPVPVALALSLPISFTFACLYFVEDGLISKLSKYVGSLSDLERELSKSDEQIFSWDNSQELRSYAEGYTLMIRVLAQLGSFLLIPSYLTFAYLEKIEFQGWQAYFLMSLFLPILILLVIQGLRMRRTTGTNVVNNH